MMKRKEASVAKVLEAERVESEVLLEFTDSILTSASPCRHGQPFRLSFSLRSVRSLLGYCRCSKSGPAAAHGWSHKG